MPTHRTVVTMSGALASAALAGALSGCAPVTTRSIAVSADEIVAIEYFEYPSVEPPDTIERLTIRNPEIIAEWMRAFTDMPLREYTAGEPDEFDDAQTQSSRLILADGREIEVTKIWIGPHDNVVLWPDATTWRTEWGAPSLARAYDDAAVIDEVDAGERPVVFLPD